MLVRIACSGARVDPGGWYAMIDRGLYHLDRFVVGSSEPPRPRARWTDYGRPAGSFRASDVVALRAQRPLMPTKPIGASWNDPAHPSGWTGGGTNVQRGKAWCASTGGANGGGGEWRTLCVSDQGLVGARFEKGGAIYRWSCGVLDGS
jgi:hypothetical protein